MEKSVEELLFEISWRSNPDEKKQAEMSLELFLAKMDVYCRQMCQTKSGNNKIMFRDLYRLLVLNIWNKASGYDDNVNRDDDELVRVKKWLSQNIMRTTIRDYWFELNRNSNVIQLEEHTHDIVVTEEDDQIIKESINLKKLKIAFVKGKVLNERELDILKTTYEFKGKIPDEIRKAICLHYEISDSYIRTIRSRALKKVNKFIKERSLVTI